MNEEIIDDANAVDDDDLTKLLRGYGDELKTLYSRNKREVRILKHPDFLIAYPCAKSLCTPATAEDLKHEKMYRELFSTNKEPSMSETQLLIFSIKE